MINEYHVQEMNKAIEKTREICEYLPDYVSRFMRSIQQRTEAKTRLEYAKDIRGFMEYLCLDQNRSPKDLTPKDLENLTRENFEDYLDYLQRYEKNGKIYTNSRNAIKRKLSSLRKFYNFLVVNDYIQINNIVKVEIPKLQGKEIIYMDAEETRDFLTTVQDGYNQMSVMAAAYHDKQMKRDYALTTLLLSTGMRVSECVGLDIDDVDLKKHCLRIIRKGGKEGVVYFSDHVTEIMSDYIEYRKHIQTDDLNEKALFLSSRRTRLGVRSVEKIVKKYAATAVPLKKITPHKLRSTYGTALYNTTNDIYAVATVLGHSNINTTAKHYSNITNKRKEEIRNDVEL